jgi:glycine/D-amino acid oxidase-like deaminating enzyme
VSGNFAWDHEKYLSTGTADQIKAMVAHFHASVDEVISVVEAEGIEADILRTEELPLATNTAQLALLHPEVKRLQRWGDPRSFIETANQCSAHVNIPGALGAIVTTGVARIQPAKLVRGLADVVERMGVTIFERSAADTIVRNKARHRGWSRFMQIHPTCHRRLYGGATRTKAAMVAAEFRTNYH